MILSEKHKFIFVKGKKVAGTSFEVLLSGICGPNDIITPITPVDEKSRILKGPNSAQNYGVNTEENNKFLVELKNSSAEQMLKIRPPKGTYYNHMPLKEVLTVYKGISESWVVFAIERCPYRKIISFANMQLNIKEYRKSGKRMVSDVKSLKKQLQKNIDDGTIINVKNIDLYKNNTGKVCVDILRFEKLEEDISMLMTKLNIATYPKLEHYKKGIFSNKLDLLNIFSKQQIYSINELFESEFKKFGYGMIE